VTLRVKRKGAIRWGGKGGVFGTYRLLETPLCLSLKFGVLSNGVAERKTTRRGQKADVGKVKLVQ